MLERIMVLTRRITAFTTITQSATQQQSSISFGKVNFSNIRTSEVKLNEVMRTKKNTVATLAFDHFKNNVRTLVYNHYNDQ